MNGRELEVKLREWSAQIQAELPAGIGLVVVLVQQRDLGNDQIALVGQPMVYTNMGPSAVQIIMETLSGMEADIRKPS